jgi:hypothetical protein
MKNKVQNNEEFDIRKINVGGSAIVGGDINLNGQTISSTDNINTDYEYVPYIQNIYFGEQAEKPTNIFVLLHKPYNKTLELKGIGPEYFDLLSSIGINTVYELSNIDPGDVHSRIVKINKNKKIVKRIPTINQLESWKKIALNYIQPI